MGLAALMFGEPKKPYSEFVRDSWAQVRRQDAASLDHLRMPKPEARLNSGHSQSPTYGRENKRVNDRYDKRKAEVEKNNSATERWSRKIDHMMATGNPDLMKSALSKLIAQQQNAEQTKARDKRQNSAKGRTMIKVGGKKAGHVQTGYMEGDNFVGVGPEMQTMSESADLQKFNALMSMPPGPEKDFALKAFYDKWRDDGTKWTNTVSGEEASQNVAEEEQKKVEGKIQGEFLESYGAEAVQREIADSRIESTIDSITELMEKTGYDTTGFASWADWVPNSNPAEWVALADTIKSRLGLAAIAEMKANGNGSTGMGAMNIAELKMVQEKLGNLTNKSGPDVVKKTLADIQTRLYRMRENIRSEQIRSAEKYDATYDDYPGKKGLRTDTSRFLQLENQGLPLTQPSTGQTGQRKIGEEWEDNQYYYKQTADGPRRSKK